MCNYLVGRVPKIIKSDKVEIFVFCFVFIQWKGTSNVEKVP